MDDKNKRERRNAPEGISIPEGIKIPFSPPDIGEEEIAEVVDTLRSGWITTGPKTKEFERQIAEYCRTDKAVCLNSATACMEMTLRLFGIGEGDEVILPAYTYTASASVVCHVGAKPVITDTGYDSFQMDYDLLAEKITPSTKAVICVDFAGVVCDYERIYKIISDKKHLFKAANPMQEALGRILVMADAAHAFGASHQGKICGEIADFTCFSFHAVKNLTTAEGGGVVWRELPGISSEDIYKGLMLLSLHGQTKDALAKTKAGAWEYDIISPAYKCNMTDIMAAIGLAQLKRFPKLLERRYELVKMYDQGLVEINRSLEQFSCVPLSHVGEEYRSSCHLYVMRIVNSTIEVRNKVIERLAEKGIATNVHYKPLPLLTAYKQLGLSIDDYPNAKAMYEIEITLPLHTKLSDEDVLYIVEQLKEILRGMEQVESLG